MTSPSPAKDPAAKDPTAERVAIRLNGDVAEVRDGQSVAELLAELRRDPRAVAVEHNGAILPRDRYPATRLRAGDRLEIVQFVQGG